MLRLIRDLATRGPAIRRPVLLALAAVLVAVAVVVSPAAAQAAEMVVVTDSGCLRLRAEPSLDATILSCLAPGSRVQTLDGTVEADGHTWQRVQAGAREGWVAATFLVPPGAGSPPAPSTPTTPSMPAAVPVFPTPPPGGLTIGRAGVPSIEHVIAAQPFEVAAAFVFDAESQRFQMHNPVLVSRLGAPPIAIAADDIVLLRRSSAGSEPTGVTTAADTSMPASVTSPAVPPRGGITTGLAGADDIESLIAMQWFAVDLVMVWDVPTQRWLSYRPGAPAFTNSLTDDALSRGAPVFLRRHPDAPDPPPPVIPEPLPEPVPPTPSDAASADAREERISFYYCERGENPAWWGDGGGWCGVMASGEIAHEGAASCARGRMGEQFLIVGDPLARIYTCKDTGGGVVEGMRDIWFPDSDSGRTWWDAVGPTAIVVPIN